MDIIGARIRELRKQRNITTKQLAELCNTSQPVISKLENGNRTADIPMLQKICEVFDITLAEFFVPKYTPEPLDDNLKDLLYSAKNLTPKQLESLTNFLKTIIQN
ncbi:Transcriptional regulator, contains XRE-family HTH domain [Anaerovirgula multivorans]|uniref:Transcriptional regulator, contains XRE-family HTH domain n=1 Tax=Anaerovirgula multivorans TaxID=312168 RepID=A0A239LKT2_9FIRM|nr:helix-turn-helix transcriptional regulator [Anaerovirgula multivorans]SNT30423.1 Transcriptional regulator, contains XRE-family HTH domain [Anaerovirgula multivorans]